MHEAAKSLTADATKVVWQLNVKLVHLSKENVALGHTGINIVAGSKAPPFAYSSNLTDTQAEEFMANVIDYFNAEVRDQFIATTKISV